MEPYEELANAIILLAVKDWRTAASALKRNAENALASHKKSESERFFLSRWFGMLTSLDGALLLEKLEKEMENRGRKGISRPSLSA